jgi:hypothetical protein
MRRGWIIDLALFLITAAVFWPLGRYDFINLDDPAYVAENPHIQQGLTAAGVAWAFRSVMVANWHPVTCLSLMLDCQLFGNSAGAHHLVNLLFHIANTLLLFHVWRRMTGELWPSALVAALFAWHPLHVESVAWISERKDVLSTFFGLLTLIAYTRYVTSAKWQVTGTAATAHAPLLSRVTRLPGAALAKSGRASLFYWLALIFFALGLMSKPMLVTWPFVLLLLDFWPLGRVTSDKWRVTRLRIPVPQLSSLRHLLLEKLPFFALVIASSVITFLVQGHSGTMSPASYLPISERAGNALVSYVRYLGKMVWPDHLAFFYPYYAWAAWQVAGSVALLALITLAAVWQAQRRPYLIVGWLWFLGTLVPVIGLVQVGMQAMGDRYSYIPLIGPFLMIIWGGKELVGRRPGVKFICGTVMAAALAACLGATSLQLRYWRNSETLCRHALEVTPHNVMVHFLLGKALIDEGKINESITQLNESLEVTPWFALKMTPWFGEIHCELAMACASQGKIQEAIDHYHEAIRYNPDLPEALNNLAWLLATCPDPKFRNGAEAVTLATEACKLTGYRKTIMVGTLAAAYAEAGRFDDAIATAQKACALASGSDEQDLLKKNQELLELYHTHKPYREIR